MNNTQQHCTICDTPATLYLCPTCIRDLQTWLDKITGEWLHALYLIATGQARPADTTARATGHGPRAPINHTLTAVHTQLANTARDAHTYARNPHAAQQAPAIINAIKTANTVIHGTETRTSHLLATHKLNTIDPMRVPALCDWYRDTLGVNLKPNRVYGWIKRGKLPHQYAYHPRDIWEHLTERERTNITHTRPNV